MTARFEIVRTDAAANGRVVWVSLFITHHRRTLEVRQLDERSTR